MQTFVITACVGIAVCAMFCYILLMWMYNRKEKRWKERFEQARTDITDMTILFQTMRDIISQQKGLARDFNAEMDKKMHLAKQVLARTMERNERLYEKQQVLARELEEGQAQLQSLQRQIVQVQTDLEKLPEPTPPAPDPTPQPPTPSVAPVAPIAPQETGEEDNAEDLIKQAPEQESIPAPKQEDELANTGLTDAAYKKWLATDFSGDVDEDEEEHEAEVPEAPEDLESAREAFRVLLDLDTATGQPAPPATGPADVAEPVKSPKNGSNTMAPLQKRVLEYSNAGMTVAEIARELGIGKGEVRLMLSLARQKQK